MALFKDLGAGLRRSRSSRMFFEGFGGAVSDQRSDSGGVRFPSADCGKNHAKKRDGRTDRHDSGGVPQIRDPSESDRSGKMGSTAQDLLVLEFLVLGQ